MNANSYCHELFGTILLCGASSLFAYQMKAFSCSLIWKQEEEWKKVKKQFLIDCIKLSQHPLSDAATIVIHSV